jgi:hypothetical protein
MAEVVMAHEFEKRITELRQEIEVRKTQKALLEEDWSTLESEIMMLSGEVEGCLYWIDRIIPKPILRSGPKDIDGDIF